MIESSDIIHIAESVVVGLFVGGSVYGAIRTDLANMKQRISELRDSAKEAHNRISDHVTNFHAK